MKSEISRAGRKGSKHAISPRARTRPRLQRFGQSAPTPWCRAERVRADAASVRSRDLLRDNLLPTARDIFVSNLREAGAADRRSGVLRPILVLGRVPKPSEPKMSARRTQCRCRVSSRPPPARKGGERAPIKRRG